LISTVIELSPVIINRPKINRLAGRSCADCKG